MARLLDPARGPRGTYRFSFQDLVLLRTAKVLKGLRGEKPSDLQAMREALARLSQLTAECPRIAELDINPLIVHPAGEGCQIADVRIRLD